MVLLPVLTGLGILNVVERLELGISMLLESRDIAPEAGVLLIPKLETGSEESSCYDSIS